MRGLLRCLLSEPLVDDTTAPFRLDTGLLTSTKPRPRLVLRRSDRSVAFEGTSGILPPQPFKLLRFMLMEAEAGRPLIDNRLIEKELWGTAIHSRQASDAIRRLRDALAPCSEVESRPISSFRTDQEAISSIGSLPSSRSSDVVAVQGEPAALCHTAAIACHNIASPFAVDSGPVGPLPVAKEGLTRCANSGTPNASGCFFASRSSGATSRTPLQPATG